MREIKFRCWFPKMGRFLDKSDDILDGLINLSNGKRVFNIDDYLNKEIREIDYFSDDGYVLNQYTGLKDKNGVEIYEGDIVVVTEEDDDSCMGREFSYKGVVSYGNSLKLSTYAPQYPSSFCLISNSFYKEQALLFNDRCDYEVVGNIYENPELLKED